MMWNKGSSKESLPDLPSKNPPGIRSGPGFVPLPSVPSAQSNRVPQFPPEEELSEIHSLPSFPDSPSHNSFSQAAIKDAVNGTHEDQPMISVDNGMAPALSGKITEVDTSWSTPSRSVMRTAAADLPTPPVTPRTSFVAPPPVSETVGFMESPRKKENASSSDVFVKIDKFHTAKRALREVDQKLREIDETIKKIKEVKMREDQELGQWEKEMLTLKARVGDVTDALFDKAS